MRQERQRGQSLIEFAFVLPLLLLLTFGIIEVSLLFYNKAMITNASREGARFGISYRVDPVTFNYSPVSDAEIDARVKSYLSNWLVTFGSPTQPITTVLERGASPGGRLRVRVAYTYRFLVFPNFATGLPFQTTLVAETLMRLE